MSEDPQIITTPTKLKTELKKKILSQSTKDFQMAGFRFVKS